MKRETARLQRSIFDLKVTLREIDPSIWRQVHVPSDILLPKLHDVLQFAIGWTDSHLHLFDLKGTRYGLPDPEWELDLRDERRGRLNSLLKQPGDRLLYEYDLGDSWEHDVVLECVLKPEPDVKYPRVAAGARACPPGDCGGSGGYQDFLRIVGDSNHPEHEETLTWAGGAFDAEAFDVDEKNRRLRG